MKVIYERDDAGGKVWRAKAWDALTAPEVEVVLRRKTCINRVPCVDVNWSACGSVGLEDAEAFVEMMAEAWRVAKEMSKEISA